MNPKPGTAQNHRKTTRLHRLWRWARGHESPEQQAREDDMEKALNELESAVGDVCATTQDLKAHVAKCNGQKPTPPARA